MDRARFGGGRNDGVALGCVTAEIGLVGLDVGWVEAVHGDVDSYALHRVSTDGR